MSWISGSETDQKFPVVFAFLNKTAGPISVSNIEPRQGFFLPLSNCHPPSLDKVAAVPNPDFVNFSQENSRFGIKFFRYVKPQEGF